MLELTITQITLVATRVVLHVGVPQDQVDQIESLMSEGLAEGVQTENDGWGDDDSLVHVVIEVYAIMVPQIAQSTLFLELAQGFQENEDGAAMYVTPPDDFDAKIIEVSSKELVTA